MLPTRKRSSLELADMALLGVTVVVAAVVAFWLLGAIISAVIWLVKVAVFAVIVGAVAGWVLRRGR